MKNKSEGGGVLIALVEPRRLPRGDFDAAVGHDRRPSGLVGVAQLLARVVDSHREIILRLPVGCAGALDGEAFDGKRGRRRFHSDEEDDHDHYEEQKDEEGGAEDPFQEADAGAFSPGFVLVAVPLGQVGVLGRRHAVDLVLGDLDDVGAELGRGFWMGIGIGGGVRGGGRVRRSIGGRLRRCAGRRPLRHGRVGSEGREAE